MAQRIACRRCPRLLRRTTPHSQPCLNQGRSPGLPRFPNSHPADFSRSCPSTDWHETSSHPYPCLAFQRPQAADPCRRHALEHFQGYSQPVRRKSTFQQLHEYNATYSSSIHLKTVNQVVSKLTLCKGDAY